VAGFRIKTVPARTSTEADRQLADAYAEVAREVMAKLDQHKVTRLFTAPHFSGAKLYQISWELEEFAYGRMMWLPKAIEPVRGRHLRQSRMTETYGEITIDPGTGKEVPVSTLPDSAYLLLEGEDAKNRYHALGAARKVVSWFLAVQYVTAWWVSYIEGWAAPRRIAKYARGTRKETKQEMERYLRTLGQNGYGLFPSDMELILEEANRQGTITTYDGFIKVAQSQYAISLLGQADTVGGKSEGGFARAVVANSIRYEVLQEVSSFVTAGWNGLVERAIRANYGTVDRRLLPSVAPIIVTPQEMSAKTTAFATLTNAGVPVSMEFVFEQILGIDPPRKGEEVVMFGKRFKFEEDPDPEPQGAQMPKEPSTRHDRDGDAPTGSRSVANETDPDA